MTLESAVAALVAAKAFALANLPLLLALGYAALNLGNAMPFLKGARAKSALSRLADCLSFLTRAEAAGTLKAPGQMSGAAPSSRSAGLKAVAAFLVPAMLFSGCAFCKAAPNSTAPRCVLEANMLSCGEADGFSLLPVVLGLIENAVAGQPFDAAALESQLEAQGVKDVPCVLAALEDFVSSEMAVAKAEDAAHGLVKAEAHVALVDALSKRGLHGHVTIKLAHGHRIEADLP